MRRPVTLKQKINEAFSSETLSDDFIADLHAQLLQSGIGAEASQSFTVATDSQTFPASASVVSMSKAPRLGQNSDSKIAWIFGSVGWGIAACLLGFFMYQNFLPQAQVSLQSPHSDPLISEAPAEGFDPEQGFVSDTGALHYTRLFPADFDTEGEAERLRPFVKEVFGDQNPDFEPGLPDHILAAFRPGAGRFLTWHGYPGVSVDLEPRDFAADDGTIESNEGSSSKATLFMIHAPEDSRLFGTHHDSGSHASFAKPAGFKADSSRLSKESANASTAGKRQIKALWRDGGVTYLLLDMPPETE